MYTVWHVDKYKIIFKFVISWTNEILQHILVSSGLSRPSIIDARARYRASAQRLRNTALRHPVCVTIFITIHSYINCIQLSKIYFSKPNKTQRYSMIFITVNALRVSAGSPAHHQELKTVYKASGICRVFTASYRLPSSLTIAVRSRKSSTNIRCCVQSFELLMMCGGTA